MASISMSFESASAVLRLLPDNILRLTNLYSLEPRQGHATRLMEMICEYADSYNSAIVLDARPFGRTDGMSQEQLVAFYERFGFKKIKIEDMVGTAMGRGSKN